MMRLLKIRMILPRIAGAHEGTTHNGISNPRLTSDRGIDAVLLRGCAVLHDWTLLGICVGSMRCPIGIRVDE